ncbi:hypothetical protein Gotri_013085, partial [Gossypium trilobum]|nr:hypothetical protein [Gossypium trilobum]
NPPDWQEILTYFRGSELQNYFTRILEDNLKKMMRVPGNLVAYYVKAFSNDLASLFQDFSDS